MANKYRRFQLKELDTDVHIKPVRFSLSLSFCVNVLLVTKTMFVCFDFQVANWLRSLGADRKQIRRIVVSYPPIIGYSVEGHLEPLVQ